jgi:hypothetical protein
MTHTLAASSQFRLPMIRFKIQDLSSMRYPLRSFLRLQLYLDVNFRPLHPNPRSAHYFLLHSLTMLPPYQGANRISLLTEWRNLSLLRCIKSLLQKDHALLIVSDAAPSTDVALSTGYLPLTMKACVWLLLRYINCCYPLGRQR